MKTRNCILLALFTLLAQGSFAHALWIETSANGEKGKQHTVKIYYGEYADQERDSVAKWFSNIKELNCWLIAPDGSKQQLGYTKEINCLQAQFTPQQDGQYIVSITHDAKDFPGETRYQWNTSAAIRIGKAEAAAFTGNDIHISAAVSTAGKSTVQIKAFIKGQPASKLKVEVVSADGWTKTFTTDEKGACHFTPSWKGRYVIEIAQTEKGPGSFEGKNFAAVWRCATTSFDWNKTIL